MMVQIRNIQKEDNEQVAKLIRNVFDEHNAPQTGTVYSDSTTDNLFAFFQKERSIFWVAAVGNEIVGCCGIYPTKGLPENCAELVKFYILKKARGQGIGKALMEKSIASALEMGYSEIYIESMPQFANAVRIYEKQGFEKLSKPMGYSGHTSCTIWMMKILGRK